MITARPIELLAPAKDFTCGIEAILHGADAVYIGAPKFSARAAAGNSVDDIRRLCDFAHLYNARIYVALNTILKDEELAEAEILIRQLYNAGVDALIIQDMGITQLDIPSIPLHASTQTDNCTPEKVKFLYKAGFRQIVLARELTLDEIQSISEYVPEATLEAFIHGALCVSYSGRCYLSYAVNGRSANRGECAQCCRLPYTMTDADDKIISENKHLLSLKDMNRSDDLEAMMIAGVSSLKIEGRLKDVSYVKNVVAYYRKKLDAIFVKNSAFYRSSTGQSSYTFEPRPEKSFNRGFTTYFLHGREMDITSFDTPKSTGEPVGAVKEIKGNSFTVSGLKPIHNGDGLVFFNSRGELDGFRVNRTEANRVFPQTMPSVKPKTQLFRNYDHDFETILSKTSAERKISVSMEWGDYPGGFTLCAFDESDCRVIITRPFEKDLARKPQDDNIKTQLSKLGNTPFEVAEIKITMSKNYFIPSSLLNEMRREAVEKLTINRRVRYRCQYVKKSVYDNDVPYPQQKLDYTANVLNKKAEEFYRKHGVEVIEPAFEKDDSTIPRFHDSNDSTVLMYTKHCLRYSMGWCPVHHKTKSLYKEPFYLTYKDCKLRLSFDCKNCRMLIL
jgi:Collagenase and related proteases